MKELFTNRNFLFYFAFSAGAIVLLILSSLNIRLDKIYAFPLYIILCLIPGYKIFFKGFVNLLKLNFKSINTLIFIAVTGAFYLGEFPEALTIVSLFAMSEFLESFGISKSKTALHELEKSIPDTATLSPSGVMVNINRISKGDFIMVKAGEKIPLDGVVKEGVAEVDQSVITGESDTILKNPGEQVFAGTMNLNGSLIIEVSSGLKESTIMKIIDMTFNATQSKSRTQKFIEKFSSIYTPSIIILAVLIIVIPVMILDGDFDRWFVNSLTLLIIACPCALVISTPLSAFSAIGTASSKGIVVKGSRVIESAGEIKAVAFDKTGTLTKSELVVKKVVLFNDISEETVISLAAGLTVHSNHPLSKSISHFAAQQNLNPSAITSVYHEPGKGLTGISDSGSKLKLGTIEFAANGNINTKSFSETITSDNKSTKVFLTQDKILLGAIYFVEELKTGAAEAVDELKKSGYFTAVLSGDRDENVLSQIGSLGIDEVHGSLLPDQKISVLEKIKRDVGKVAMVGDGINDAPSIAASDLGISFGKTGTDLAAETADAVLMNEDLKLIPFLLMLGKRTVNIIKFNIGFSLSVKVVFIFLALLGMSSLVGAILADVGLTILVVINSLRLLKIKNGH